MKLSTSRRARGFGARAPGVAFSLQLNPAQVYPGTPTPTIDANIPKTLFELVSLSDLCADLCALTMPTRARMKGSHTKIADDLCPTRARMKDSHTKIADDLCGWIQKTNLAMHLMQNFTRDGKIWHHSIGLRSRPSVSYATSSRSLQASLSLSVLCSLASILIPPSHPD